MRISQNSNYQSYTGNSFYGELRSMLDKVKIDKSSVTTSGNVKLEVTTSEEVTTFRWVYTFTGVNAADKCVVLGYKVGFLKFFIDNWNLHKIGSVTVNISEEQAVNTAMAYARTYSWPAENDNDTFPVKNFNVTGAMMVETVFRSSLIADTPRNNDLLTLYPMRHVWVSLDKFYPGNVYGFNVYVWADTGAIAHIQERISTMDPPPEPVATANDITAQPVNEQLASV